MSENGLQMAPDGSGEGNTNSSPACRISASKQWIFTWNNYDGSKIDEFCNLLNSKGKYIFGIEVAPSTGTPHLQGYVNFNKKQRPIECFGDFSNKISWRKMSKDATEKDNLTYCSKDGNYRTNMVIKKPVIDPLAGKEYYPWQQQIVNLVDGCIQERKIHWFWESIGKRGKSSFTKHLCMTKEGCLMVTGKAADVKLLYHLLVQQ